MLAIRTASSQVSESKITALIVTDLTLAQEHVASFTKSISL